jgi:acetyl esterase
MPLDADAAAFLKRLAEVQAPPTHQMAPGEARSLLLPMAGLREQVGGIESFDVESPDGSVSIRLYTPFLRTEDLDRSPSTGGRPVALYFHGGGWVMGSVETHDNICRRLSNEAKCIVISAEYRLAPEHKYPAALNDCYAATCWAAQRHAEFGGDPQRIFVTGDSAGANLATAVCLRARDEQGPALAGQVLVYPITDCCFDTPSYVANAHGYMLTRDTMQWFWNHYLPEGNDGRHCYQSPLRATSLAGLPPALVVTCEFDPLLDEGRAYADRLAAEGVPTTYIEEKGMIHGYLRRLDSFRRAQQTMRDIAAWINGRQR